MVERGGGLFRGSEVEGFPATTCTLCVTAGYRLPSTADPLVIEKQGQQREKG